MAKTDSAVTPQRNAQTVTAVSPPITIGARGLVLTTLADMRAFADCVISSGLAPKGLERPEAIIIALQLGAELGLPPMASLQNIAVINGRPSVWGDAMLAVCRASPAWGGSFREEFTGDPSTDQFAAVCTVARLGEPPISRTFSIAAAKRAGLWGKAGPWQQYPWRMLQMRARSWALRDAFPDVLRGIYSAEEVADMDGPSAEVADAEPEPARGVAAVASHIAALTASQAHTEDEAAHPKQVATQRELLDVQASATEAGL